MRHLHPMKYLLLFYNAYARSLISYGLLGYGSAGKTNLEMLQNAQRRIIRAIFHKQNQHSLKDIIDAYHIHTVFDLYVLVQELFEEVFKQIRIEPSLHFLQVEKEQPRLKTRFTEKVRGGSLGLVRYCIYAGNVFDSAPWANGYIFWRLLKIL